MAEEEGQIFPGGEITVATAELNPIIEILQTAYCKYSVIGREYKCEPHPEYFVKDRVVEIPILDPTVDKPSFFATIKNVGDETIDVTMKIIVDDLKEIPLLSLTEKSMLGFPLGKITIPIGASEAMFTETGVDRTVGKHIISWKVQAKRITERSYPAIPQIVGNTIYYVYTAALDAIATTVKIVQGTVEQLWLTGTPEGFTAQPVTIAPNEPAYFKFELTNPGDEPVRMNVGHLVGTVYETGFLVGGVLMDTIEKDVLVNAGATAVINTEAFTPLAAGSLTIGSFAVLRARHLI